jgi:hypothetical protein
VKLLPKSPEIVPTKSRGKISFRLKMKIMMKPYAAEAYM